MAVDSQEWDLLRRPYLITWAISCSRRCRSRRNRVNTSAITAALTSYHGRRGTVSRENSTGRLGRSQQVGCRLRLNQSTTLDR